jgi:hypothetical protein
MSENLDIDVEFTFTAAANLQIAARGIAKSKARLTGAALLPNRDDILELDDSAGETMFFTVTSRTFRYAADRNSAAVKILLDVD